MQLDLVRLCLPLLFFLLGVPSCRFPQVGLRLLDIDIVHDGKLAFSGIWGIPDNTSFKQVWDVLGDVPFEASGGEVPDTTDENADSVTLTGKVLIRIKHVDRVLAEAELSELKLVRSGGTSTWTRAAGEGQRLHAGQHVGAVLRLLFGAGVWSILVWFVVLLIVGFPLAIWLGNMTWTQPAG